jgi:hypothetical protein
MFAQIEFRPIVIPNEVRNLLFCRVSKQQIPRVRWE